MISRTLVPRDVKPVNRDELKKNGTRVTTYLDDRTVIPAGPSDAPPLDGKSNIPEHLPLDVLVDRTLVPRGMPIKPIERSVETQAKGAMALEVLDARLVVPAHVKPLEPEQEQQFARPIDTAALGEMVEPDIFLTGDANLLIEEEKRDTKWDNIARMGSIAAHIVLILFLVNIGRIFKQTAPSQADLERAQKELSFVYLPPEQATPPPVPKMPRIDPKMLERMAPPVEKPEVPAPAPQPPPQPVKPQPDLPEAPTPHVATPQPPAPQPPQQLAQNTPPPQPQSQLEPIKPSNNHLNLQLPNESPGQVLAQQEQDAIKRRGPSVYIPNNPGPSGPMQGSPGRNAVNILTPTEGVDFNSYIQRMLATIKQNWDAVMPQSAMLGDKGVVYITFQINPDGSVEAPDPQMQRTSGKPPLDNAAMSAIRASNPFEPLPKEFHGPYMRFGIFFLYNLPVDYLNNH